MPKREVFYGVQSWRDLKFDVVAAEQWLARVGTENPSWWNFNFISIKGASSDVGAGMSCNRKHLK